MSVLPDPLHPALVHFPIALIFVALLFEALSRTRRWRALDSAAVFLIVLAAVGSVAAFVTGKLAYEEVVVPPAGRQLLEQHESFGVLVMVGMLLLAGARLLLARGDRHSGPLNWLYLGVLALAAALVTYQAHLGGRLVYDHGVGTAPSLSKPIPPPESSHLS
ncbi:MAG: DUF2231 domain-containing protein [Acidobacteriota bacterium]|jgi:uncharacterized membrane protein